MKKDDLFTGMQKEMQKRAAGKSPDLVKASECLHAALEIFESAGLQNQAEQILNIMQKIAEHHSSAPVVTEAPSLHKLMGAGLTQRDLIEFSKGNLKAKAKVNLVLKSLGMSNYEINEVIGSDNVMSEEDAKKFINPNETLTLESIAKKKVNNINKQAVDESEVNDLLEADIDVDVLEAFDKLIPLDFEDER